jgi:(1->4)-alpha-D-glucan 1-alpha-D-glucosylmutase
MTLDPIPTSTYRLQFGPTFRFTDAMAIVPYLDRLGVGTLYASPYLKARAGSTHGYDIVDPNSLNPEIGTNDEHAALIAAAQARGIGHLLDFVPNHMGIGPDNPWWNDVLAWGERSPYAKFFDIDWRPLRPDLHGKVLVPFLGDHYGRVLENGELQVAFDERAGTFAIAYYANRFPLAPVTYAPILRRAGAGLPALRQLGDAFAAARSRARDDRRVRALRRRIAALERELAERARAPEVRAAIARACASFTADPGNPQSADALDDLLGAQHYRLAFWRVAVDDINYRRFFDINDLAGIRVEDAEVLAQTHRLIFAMIADGRLQGLRIDHIDGLYNPGGYANLLHERAEALGHPLYLVIEKILAPFERLRADWLVDGTTGYEFMNAVNGLFVDSNAERFFDRIYARALGSALDYHEVALEAKRSIININLASELSVLATDLARIAASDRRSSDFTFIGLRRALTEVVAAFPVYRTYVASEDLAPEGREFIEAAVALAQRRSALADTALFDFIADVLCVRVHLQPGTHYDRNAVLRFAMRFQQYTSPVMAKSIEDTAFYRYVRLVSLNEVGGEPTRFGTSLEDFHAANGRAAQHHPHGLLATATHDHKRGEDTRLRIDALSETPAEWSRALRRWARLNRGKRGNAAAVAPSTNDEYLLYQILLGTWPIAWRDPGAIASDAYDGYVERILAYMEKATREAKVHTSWANQDAAYEEGTRSFVRGILDRANDNRFPGEIAAFAGMLSPIAMIHSLAQVVLKCTSPGVPDIYQGCELWDFSLVDPDNRRPVDYAARDALLARASADPEAALKSWDDGAVKLAITRSLLHLRREQRETFASESYVALQATGPWSDRIVAFARGDIIVVAPRLVRPFLDLDAAVPRLRLSEERLPVPAATYRERFTGARIEAPDGTISLAALLNRFPIAVLLPIVAGGP